MARVEIENFRRNVASLCAEHGEIQRVADQAEISRVFLSKIINGHATPSMDVALQLCDALGFTLQSLMEAPTKFSRLLSRAS